MGGKRVANPFGDKIVRLDRWSGSFAANDHPLRYIERGRFRTRWEVVSGGIVIGSISQNILSRVLPNLLIWTWTLRVPQEPLGFQHQGQANTFEDAKAKLESMWAMWLEAAGLQSKN